MNTDIIILTAKAMVGEKLTDHEKKILKDYNGKYELVRFLVMDKHKSQYGLKLENFHFTPGEEFMNTPVIDVANAVLETLSAISKEVKFGDGSIQFDGDGNQIPPKSRCFREPSTNKKD